MTTIDNTVQAYTTRGWAVFPVGTAPDVIRNGHNIGLDCGKSGLVVIDLDVKGDHDGLAAWETLKDDTGLDDTGALVTETPSGGRHLIWTDPTGGLIGNSASKLAPGIDVRANGGYIVAPPSRTADGAYRWLRDGDPGPLPPELVKLLLQQPKPSPSPPRTIRDPSDAEPYAAAALKDETATVAGTAPGGRNERLNTSAFALGQLVGAGALSRSEVEAALYNAALDCGLVTDDGERAVRLTIRSGLDAGEREPRRIPEPQTSAQRRPERGSAGNGDTNGDAGAERQPERVNTWPYAIEDGRIVYQKLGSDDEVVSTPVADFTAQITRLEKGEE